MTTGADTTLLAAELRDALGRLVRRMRADMPYSLSQGAVLGRLEREGPLSTSDLAAAERVRPQSMAQTVSELQAGGLIARNADPDDRRRALLELTEAGRAEVAKSRGRKEGWLSQALDSGFSPEERELLERALPLLERLAEL